MRLKLLNFLDHILDSFWNFLITTSQLLLMVMYHFVLIRYMVQLGNLIFLGYHFVVHLRKHFFVVLYYFGLRVDLAT